MYINYYFYVYLIFSNAASISKQHYYYTNKLITQFWTKITAASNKQSHRKQKQQNSIELRFHPLATQTTASDVILFKTAFHMIRVHRNAKKGRHTCIKMQCLGRNAGI